MTDPSQTKVRLYKLTEKEFDVVETGGHSPPVLAEKIPTELSRNAARALADAGYMPTAEYVRLFGHE